MAIKILLGILTLFSAITQNSLLAEPIAYSVIKKPEIIVIGIECRTSNAPDAGVYDIPRLWQQFFSENIKTQIPNKISDEIIALYCDYESDHTQNYSLVIGCAVSTIEELPEGMIAKTIPVGSYAVFSAVGEYPDCLIETWQSIWQTDLKRTYTSDYEFYGDKFLTAELKEVDVFIAIED